MVANPQIPEMTDGDDVLARGLSCRAPRKRADDLNAIDPGGSGSPADGGLPEDRRIHCPILRIWNIRRQDYLRKRNKAMSPKGPATDRTPPGFFSNLDDRERIILFNSGTIRILPENEPLFMKGMPGATIFCVMSGTLKVAFGESGGAAFRFKTGDLISETALSEGKGRISSVVAEEASTVFSLDLAAFDTLGVETRAAILKKLHDSVLSRIEILGGQNESIRIRQAALERYIGKFRKQQPDYGNSEIIVEVLKSIPEPTLHVAQLMELPAGKRTEVYRSALSRVLGEPIVDSDEFREIHHHSVFLSYIASELCRSYDGNKAALLGTIGLLHDIGEIVLLLLRNQDPKWSFLIGMLDPSKLGAMLLEKWNTPKPICRTVEYQAWPVFSPPGDLPADQKANIALFYIAHTVCDYLDNKRAGLPDHVFLDDYLRLLGFVSFGIDEISRDFILHGLRTKSESLPDFVRSRL
jgi:CRP-like cAMP-binding protein